MMKDMLIVAVPQTREEVSKLMHNLMALVEVLPHQMMQIDLTMPNDEEGSGFSDCDGSRLMELMVLSSYAAMKIGRTKDLMLAINEFMTTYGPEMLKAEAHQEQDQDPRVLDLTRSMRARNVG